MKENLQCVYKLQKEMEISIQNTVQSSVNGLTGTDYSELGAVAF